MRRLAPGGGLPDDYSDHMVGSVLFVDDGPRIVNTIALVLGIGVLYAVGSAISNASRQRRRKGNGQDDIRK